MGTRTATNAMYDAIYKDYAGLIFPFIKHIVTNGAQAQKVLNIVLMEIPVIKTYPTKNINHFSQIQQFARNIAIAFLDSDPTFDKLSEWEKLPDYYPLTHPALTEMHKKAFCLFYYRAVSTYEISVHFEITQQEVAQLLRETTALMGHIVQQHHSPKAKTARKRTNSSTKNQ